MAKMFANLTKLGQSAASHAVKLRDGVANIQAQSNVQASYTILPTEIGHAAASSTSPRTVSVWILDKRALHDPDKPIDTRPIIAQLEQEAKQALKLRHPGVVSVLEPLEETRTHLFWVTEEVQGSLMSWMLAMRERGEPPPAELELKHGFVKIAEALHFLHGSCNLAHCNLSPESIVVAADGTWKLAGMAFVTPISPAEDVWHADAKRTFAYDWSSTLLVDRIVKPPLQFTAPELAGSVSDAPVTGKADVFSLACVMYQELLRGMLARAVHARPPVRDIPDASYFKQDRLLRALRFLDTLVQRDAAQKAAFLRDLPAFWAQFDARTLRLRVLPALMALWHDEALRDGVLPLVLTIAQDLPADTFQNQARAGVAFVWPVLPELRPILASAQGAQLHTILAALPKLHAALRVDQVEDALVPLFLRTLAQPDTRLQEEALSAFRAPLAKVGGACLHARILPEVMKACMRTKAGAVRAAALAVLSDAAPRLTEAESAGVVRAIARVAAVDKSAATLQHALRVADAIAKAKSPEYGVQMIVPLLSPLLATHTLPPALLQDMLACVRSALTRLEKACAGGAAANGSVISSQNGAAASAADAASWDDVASVPAATSANGSAAALGLGMGAGPAEDSWASLFGAAGGADSAAHSAASSPSSLRSGTGGGASSFGAAGGPTAANAMHGGAAGGSSLRSGGAAQPLHRAPQNAAQPNGAARPGAPMNAARSQQQGTSGNAAARDAFAGLAVSAAAKPAPLPAIPPPPKAATPAPAKAPTADPFAELCMAQPAPQGVDGNLHRNNGARQGGGQQHTAATDNPWGQADQWGGDDLDWVGAQAGAMQANINSAGAKRQAGEGGGGWDEWDPFT